MNEAERYTLEIKWYPEGQLYGVIAPEWTADWSMPISEGKPLPEPAVYAVAD